MQKAYELYQEYKKSYRSIPLRTIEREFIELRIDDAEELLLITALRENGEIKYKLNQQILKITEKPRYVTLLSRNEYIC